MDRRRILLVDDSELTLMLEKTVLSSENYDVMTARDGQEALAIAERELPDLILLDILMPGMDGFEVCSALRKNAKTKDIPIIMLSVKGQEDQIKAGFDSGCDDYITKPFKSVELLAKISSFLSPTKA